jgi:Tfp pilus assembly protein PilF
MREALKLGTRDARLFFHAGLIEARLGNRQAARDYLTRALAINPRFHVLHADIAVQMLRELNGDSGDAHVRR